MERGVKRQEKGWPKDGPRSKKGRTKDGQRMARGVRRQEKGWPKDGRRSKKGRRKDGLRMVRGVKKAGERMAKGWKEDSWASASDEPFALPMKLVWIITGEREVLGVKRKMALERYKEVETSRKASGTRIGTQSEVLPALFNFMPCQPVVLPTENFDFTCIGVFRV
ncbi:hypothetical protein RUM43_011817 [Polyplax serrata]|uniref:Uncharacterized protein n=1 Tax=Polyplax serrata TaxID=468196 RepID=A0AAN8NYT6_POLSC